MYGISELDITRKEMAVLVLAVLVFMVVVFSGGYMCGLYAAGETGKDVSDNGNTVENIRTEVESAGSSIDAAKSGIDGAAAAAGRIEERIDNATERAEYVKTTSAEGRRLIADCKSIIDAVRARGEAGKAAN